MPEGVEYMFLYRKDREVNSTHASGLGILLLELLILRGMIAYKLGIDVTYGMVHGSGRPFPCRDNCLI